MATTAAAPTAARPPIALDLIDESPFNPRKEFAGIEELAASIKEQGLLEGLLLRPTKAGRYELVFGARRLRALKHNKVRELTNYDVRPLDDDEAMAVQIVENLQREDVTALEEAEAFARLQDQDPAKWTAGEIARTIGKTPRVVQQRLAIARNLAPALKKRLADGELSVEAARTLAAFPARVQNEIPKWTIERADAAEIRRFGFDKCIPESAAKFDVALYKGAWIEGDKPGSRYFADTALFTKLQRPAAEKKLAEVKTDWPKAELVTADEAARLQWADTQYVYSHSSGVAGNPRDGDKPAKYLVPKEKCTAIVWIAANGQIRKALGVCTAADVSAAERKRAANRTGPGNARVLSPAGEKAAHKKARKAFNAAVAKAAAGDPVVTDRLLLLLALTNDFGHYHAVNKVLPPALVKLRPGYQDDGTGETALWQTLLKLTPAAVKRHCRDVVLAHMPEWRDHEHKRKPLLMVALANSLAVDVPAIALPEPPAPKADAKSAATKKAAPKTKAKAKKKGGRK